MLPRFHRPLGRFLLNDGSEDLFPVLPARTTVPDHHCKTCSEHPQSSVYGVLLDDLAVRSLQKYHSNSLD
jgi:hypothetical protein